MEMTTTMHDIAYEISVDLEHLPIEQDIQDLVCISAIYLYTIMRDE